MRALVATLVTAAQPQIHVPPASARLRWSFSDVRGPSFQQFTPRIRVSVAVANVMLCYAVLDILLYYAIRYSTLPCDTTRYDTILYTMLYCARLQLEARLQGVRRVLCPRLWRSLQGVIAKQSHKNQTGGKQRHHTSPLYSMVQLVE